VALPFLDSRRGKLKNSRERETRFRLPLNFGELVRSPAFARAAVSRLRLPRGSIDKSGYRYREYQRAAGGSCRNANSRDEVQRASRSPAAINLGQD